MARPKPKPEPLPVPSIPLPPTIPTENLPLGVPESLDITLPDFSSQLPSDWYKPSSSNVPRTDSQTFLEESQIATEQKNSLVLQGLNLDNAKLTIKNAVKGTQIAELLMNYKIGVEKVRTAAVKLVDAQFVTANAQKQVLITQEQGRQLDTRLTGEQLKTQMEVAKNELIQVDVSGYQALKPIAEQAWKNRLAEAEAKNQEMLNSFN